MADNTTAGDFSACAEEPIHIPGALQPFSLVLVIGEDGQILAASENTLALFNIPATSVIGKNIHDVEEFRDIDLDAFCEPDFHAEIVFHNQRYIVHQVNDDNNKSFRLLEIERLNCDSTNGNTIESKIQRLCSTLVNIDKIETLHKTLVESLKLITGYSRCMVYQFDEEYNGAVIAEDVDENLTPFLGLHYPATDIPVQARALYLKKRVRLIEYTDCAPVPIVSDVGHALDLTHVSGRAISPVHIQYMKNMGVTASLVISITVKGKLWGLIACHDSKGRKYFDYYQRRAFDTLGTIVSLITERLNNESSMRYKQKMAQSLSALSLSKFMSQPDKYQNILSGIQSVTHSDGVLWTEIDKVWQQGLVPNSLNVKALLEYAQNTAGTILYLNPITSSCEDFDDPEIAEVCIIKLAEMIANITNTTTLLLFRKPMINTVTWAGDPREKQLNDSMPGGIAPRASFNAWKEKIQNKGKPWQIEEKEVIQTLQKELVEASYLYFTEQQSVERRVIDGSADFGIWSLDLRTQFLEWNQRMFEIYGVSKAKFNNRYEDWICFLEEEDKKAASFNFEKAIFERSTFQHTFKINNSKTGKRVIRAYADVLNSPSGEPIKVIGTNIDITEQVAAVNKANDEIHLTETQGRLLTLGELAAAVGHEINNPLAIILTTLELNRLSILEDKHIQQLPSHLRNSLMKSEQTIDSAANRIAKIVKGLRSMASNSNDDGSKHSCNVNNVISDVSELLSTLYKTNSLKIDVHDVQEEATAQIDESALQQIIVNLVSNANEAMSDREQKNIDIGYETTGQFVTIYVRDYGTGIPQELVERIFAPFFSTKPASKGTGLGLSISRSIVRQTGGDLFVKSNISEGSTFYVKIPLTKQNKPSEVKHTKFKYDARLLIVDDEEGLLTALSGVAEHLGCSVHIADSALHALDLISRYNIDILLTDYHLPGMNGLQLIEKTANLPALKVIMTGDVSFAAKHNELEKVGVSKVLEKPVSLTDLKSVLDLL